MVAFVPSVHGDLSGAGWGEAKQAGLMGAKVCCEGLTCNRLPCTLDVRSGGGDL